MGFLKDIVADAKLRPSVNQASDEGEGITYNKIDSPAAIKNSPGLALDSVADTDFTDLHDGNEASVSANEMLSPANNNEVVQPPFSFAQHPEHIAGHRTNNPKGINEHLTFSRVDENDTSTVAEPVVSGEMNTSSQLDESYKTGLNPPLNREVAQSPVIEPPIEIDPVVNDVNEPDVNDPEVNNSTGLQSIEKNNFENNEVAVNNTRMQIEANHSKRQTLENDLVEGEQSEPMTAHVELSEPRKMDTVDTPSVAAVLHDTGLNHGVNLNKQQPYSEPQQQFTVHPAKDLKSNSMPSTEQDGVNVNMFSSTRQVKELNPQAEVSLTPVGSGTPGADALPQSSSQTDVSNNRATMLTARHDKDLTNSSLQVDSGEASEQSNSNRSNIAPGEDKLRSEKTNANDSSDLNLPRTEDALISSSRLSRQSITGEGVSNTLAMSDAEATGTITRDSSALTEKDNAKLPGHLSKETTETLQTYSSIQAHKNKTQPGGISAAPQAETVTNRVNSPSSVAGSFRKSDNSLEKMHPFGIHTDDASTLAQQIYHSPLADHETSGGNNIAAAKSAATVIGSEKSKGVSNTPRTYLDSVLQRNTSAAIEQGLSGLKQAKQLKADALKSQNRSVAKQAEKIVSATQQASVLSSSNVSGGRDGTQPAQPFNIGHGLRIPTPDKTSSGPTAAKPAPPQFEPPKLEIGQIDIVVEEAEVKEAPSRSVHTAPQDFASRHYLRRL